MSDASTSTKQTPHRTAKLRRTITGSAMGNIVEQYDFSIYGSISALIFGKLFFPSEDPTLATLAAFSTFAVGFLARPIGGVIAGHFGDLYGRKRVLIVMLLLAGITTALMGLLPTHATAGVWAPVLLVALRFLQGVSFGGEYGGAVLMVNESAPAERRGFYTGFIPASSALGVVVAQLMILAVALLPDRDFEAWGWRIPFLASVVLIGIGLFVRRRIDESVAFQRQERRGSSERAPLLAMIRSSPRSFFCTIAITLGLGTVNYLVLVWLLSYLSGELGLPRYVGLVGLIVGELVYAAAALAGSAYSDQVGRRSVIRISSVALAMFAFPFIWIIDTGNVPTIWLAMCLALALVGAIYGPLSSLMCEQFATKHRYSGASSAYQLGQTLGGGLSPLIATALFAAVGASWVIASYVLLGSLICAVAAHFVTETAREELRDN